MSGNNGISLLNLPELTSASGNDRIVIVDTSVTPANTKEISLTNLFSNSVVNTSIQFGPTPANSIALVVANGTLWQDGTYIYVATANNYVMRSAALSIF